MQLPQHLDLALWREYYGEQACYLTKAVCGMQGAPCLDACGQQQQAHG